MLFLFENFALDCGRRELRLAGTIVPVEPQVFDILVYLIANRDRVVSKDDLIESVWGGRIVSESTLTSRINAVRRAVGDSGDKQEFVRTRDRRARGARRARGFVRLLLFPVAPLALQANGVAAVVYLPGIGRSRRTGAFAGPAAKPPVSGNGRGSNSHPQGA